MTANAIHRRSVFFRELLRGRVSLDATLRALRLLDKAVARCVSGSPLGDSVPGSSQLRHESLGRSYAAEAVLESLIAPLYLCMRVTVEALEDWRYVDAIDRVLEACLAGAAWHPVRDAEAPEHRNSSLSN